MSFHGGFVGVLLAMWYFAHKYKKKHPLRYWILSHPVYQQAYFFGRIGNFINGELWGRISYADVSHLMYFPQAARVDFEMIQANPALQDITANIGGYLLLPRHPSQLYQAATEGILLFVVLWWFSAKPRPRYAVSAVFFYWFMG